MPLWVYAICKVIPHLVHIIIHNVMYLRGGTFQEAGKKRGAVKNIDVILRSRNPEESMPEIKPVT
jgi:hypothetical protein